MFELIASFSLGAIGSFVLWVFYGLPKVRQAIDKKEAELKTLLITKEEEWKTWASMESEKARAAIPGLLKENAPALVEALAPLVKEQFTAMAPELVDAFIERGAKNLAEKSNASQSLAKNALGSISEADIQGILGKLTGGGGSAPDLSSLLGGLGGSGSPVNPAAAILSAIVPKKYAQYVPLLFGARNGGTAPSPGSSAGYSPGIRR